MMLRSPIDILKDHRLETISTIAVVVLSLLIPASLLLVILMNQAAVGQWLQKYRPVIYVAASSNSTEISELKSEIESWRFVQSVELRDQVGAFRDLEERLGAERLFKLGVTEGMLPVSFIIEPAVPVMGHIELASRVAGLEARPQIHSVDVPDSRALKPLGWIRAGIILAIILALLLATVAVLSIYAFLRRLEVYERTELELLELFGAPLIATRHPSWIRGVVVGSWSGVLGFILVGGAVFVWHYYQSHIWGASFLFEHWIVLIAVLVAGPILGAIGGWLAKRTRQHNNSRHENHALTRSLLYWEQRT